MTFLDNWEEFEKAAERLYLQDPMKVRYSTKYNHSAGYLELKMTDDAVCLQVFLLSFYHFVSQYKSDAAADVKKMEKYTRHLLDVKMSNDEKWQSNMEIKFRKKSIAKIPEKISYPKKR